MPFFIRHYEKFREILSNLEDITNEKWFPKNDNVEGLTFLYVYTNKFNLHFMEGSFHEGLPMVQDVLEGLKKQQNPYC